MDKKNIYIDNSATTQIVKPVYDAMISYLKNDYGNASSLHNIGIKTKKILNNCREKIAKLILANDSSNIIFTSGGTEANNLAIKGLIYNNIRNKIFDNHIITSKIEHPSILNTIKYLKDCFNVKVTYLNVDKHGIIDINEFQKSFNKNTKLVTIMYANNEIGTLQPIKEIIDISHSNNIPVHTDAVQAIGHEDIKLNSLNVDLLSLSGHKIHGPKGIGCLYIKNRSIIDPIIHGGKQENDLRSGTEPVELIIGLTEAINFCIKNLKTRKEYISKLSDYLIKNVMNKIPKAHLLGHYDKRLKNIINFSFEAVEGEALLLLLNNYGIYASTGSACSSKTLKKSHVLKAIGIDDSIAHGSLRISLSHFNTMEEIDYIIIKLIDCVNKLRTLSPIWK